jgi:hypothetical protein
MPSALNYVPPTDKDRHNLWVQANMERERRRAQYQLNLSYYRGDHPKTVPVEYDDRGKVIMDDNVIINLIKTAADRTSTFVMPTLPVVRTDLDRVERNEWDLYLEKFIREKMNLHFLTKWVLRGSLAGHTFLQVSDVDGEPHVTLLDPVSVAAYWRADDVADVIWYEMLFYIGGILHVRDYYKVDTGWSIDTYKAKGEPSNNTLASVLFPDPQSNISKTYSTAATFPSFEKISSVVFTMKDSPVLSVPHLPDPDNYYGHSDFGQMNLQDAINRLASIRNQIARESSAPVDFIAGADPKTVSYDGGVFSSPNPDAKVVRLETKGDLAGLTNALESLVSQLLAQLRVVLLKGDAKDLQRVTNASVRTLFLDALAKNEILRDTYLRAIKAACRVALAIGYKHGKVPMFPNDREIYVSMDTPLPVDKTENANVVALGIAGGYMSRRSGAELMGLNWQFEQANIEGEVAYLTKTQNYASIKDENQMSSPEDSSESKDSGQ